MPTTNSNKMATITPPTAPPTAPPPPPPFGLLLLPAPEVEVLSEVLAPKVEELYKVSGLEDESLSVGGSDARVRVVAGCVDSSVTG